MKGIVVSKGVGIGKAYVLKESVFEIPKATEKGAEMELEALKNALGSVKADIEKTKIKAIENIGKSAGEILDAHLMFLEDPEFFSKIKELIETQGVTAAYATEQVKNEFVALMEAIDDAYLKERANDIRDVGSQLVRKLMGIKNKAISEIDEEVILVAEDLTPSETALINTEFVKGFVTALGGKTSHTAIMANNLGLPAMVGAVGIMEAVKDGDWIVLDCLDSELSLNPSEDERKHFTLKLEAYESYLEELSVYKDVEAVTADGFRIEVGANIGKPKDVKGALSYGAEGVGLFRTEFVYMDSNDFPTEEEQFQAYKAALEGMAPRPVIIRTFDVGGDKDLSYFPLPKEMNPFMGYRAIRISLKEEKLFMTQLRAILRASAFGKCKIMFPMISSIEELREAKAFLEAAKRELREEGVAFDEGVLVGIMVEIPSVAAAAQLYADETDFFSIGTNDLTQYTLAVDRMSEQIAPLYDSFNPGVMALLANTIKAGVAEQKMVGMCGEMAGNPYMVPFLVGLGMTELSMSPSKIPLIKRLLSKISVEEAKVMAEGALKLKTSAEVQNHLRDYLEKLEITLF